MKLNFQLQMEQTQKLIMTPELRQAIEILQYNALELNQFVHEELMTNPVLELNGEENALSDNSERLSELTERIDWKQVVNDDERNAHTYQKQEEAEEFTMDNIVADEVTLHDHLMFQLHFTLLNPQELTIGRYIIENIDACGYLKIDPQEIMDAFSIDEDVLEDVIQTLQTFDPYGVCARDLQECLLIQIQMRRIEQPLAIEIINNHLDDLANNRMKQIAKTLNTSERAIQAVTDVIKTLDPKPGLKFASMRDVRYVIPDVTVKEMDGEYVILVNEASAPKLRISEYYRKLIRTNTVTEEASAYIQQKLGNALKLIKSIEQRRNTIYRVVEAILKFQEDFFKKGTMYLKVLNLKDVADEIGVHESTVSRAVSGKYLQCPRGLFEMKYFFQSGVSTAFGDGVSAESIKSIIKELVDKEDPTKPVSDQHICNEITKIGIRVSRRTIAKYRDELNIAGSSKRKRFY